MSQRLFVWMCLSVAAAFVVIPSAWAAFPELPGDGFDDSLATGGTAAGTYGSCPSGYMNSVKGPQGCDHKCPAPDEDCDGYTSDGSVGWAGTTYKDVDDNNRDVIPGEYYPCDAGGGANSGYRLARTDGTWGTCTSNSTPLCEATGSGVCKYIDCGSGLDSNSGTYSSPYQSFGKVSGGTTDTTPPSPWTATAGSVVYLKGSTNCTATTLNAGALGSAQGSFTVAGTAVNKITFKSYPGAAAEIVLNDIGGLTFNPNAASGGAAFNVVDGLTFTGSCVASSSYGNTPVFSHADDLEVRRIYVHDYKGNTYNNTSGIYGNATNRQYYHHNFFLGWRQAAGGTACHNQANGADFTAGDNGGNVNAIKLLDNAGGSTGRDQRIMFNSMVQTYSNDATISGGCIFYKHGIAAADAGISGTQLKYNICAGTTFYVLNGSKNRIMNNFVYGGALVYEFEGGSDFTSAPHEDNVEEYNTVYGPGATLLTGRIAYTGFGTTPVTDEKHTVDHNILYDTRSSYNQGNNEGVFTIDGYGSNAQLTQYEANNANTGTLRSDYNCFYNPNTSLVFNYFGQTSGGHGPAGSAGGFDTFAQWQALTRPQDTHSNVENPNFDAYYRSTSSHCSDKGWTGKNIECESYAIGSATPCF